MKKILAISILLALSGCADKNGNIFNPNLFGSSETSLVDEDAKIVSDLQSVPITAQDFSDVEVTYLTLNKKVSFSLSQQDRVMKLNSGKTYVKVFALPQLDFDQGIHLESEARETVVVPYLQFLDGSFEAVGAEFSPAHIKESDTFDLVAPAGEIADSIRYVAIYSHQDQYGMQSALFDVEQQRKKENGIDTPTKPWLKTTHVPVGNMTIEIERVESQ